MVSTPSGRPALVTERAAGAPLALHAYLLAGTAGTGAALAGMTQLIAAHFAYDPRLGRALVVLADEPRLLAGVSALLVLLTSVRLLLDPGRRRHAPALWLAAGLLALAWCGPVYHPARVIEWWPQLRARPESALLLVHARLAGCLLFVSVSAGALGAARPPRVRRAGMSHGSSTWGTGDEFRATAGEIRDLREGNGIGASLVLGRHDDGTVMLLRERMGHLITVASTRSGKGVGTVIPNALAYRGSMIITDPKAEAFFVTAPHRRDRFGQRIYALDPWEVTLRNGESQHEMRARYNPLGQISTIGPEARLAVDRVRALVETLVLESKGENAFWDRMARQVATGLLLYICVQFDAKLSRENAFPIVTPFGRDLLTLRFLTCLGADDFQAVLLHMGRSVHPEVRRVSAMLVGADYRTRQNIMTSVQAQLAFLDSPQMATVLGEFVRSGSGDSSSPNLLPSADLQAIKEKGVRQTVYLVVPPPFLETHAPWLRLMIVAINEIVTSTTAPPELPILAMLDEFANLGRLDAVRRGVSLVGGYGIRFWMIVQDIQQVEAVYDKAWGTLFANAFVKQLFGTNDLRTAKELSELTGEATVYSDSGNSGKSLDSVGWVGKGSSVGESMAEKGRKLLLPDEVLGMPAHKQLLQIRGHRPLYISKLNYLEMEEVQGLYAPNPMY